VTWISEIQDRVDAATPGPWKNFDPGWRYVVDPHNDSICDLPTGSEFADANFIAHARSDIPRLLAEVEYANKRADQLQEGISAKVTSNIESAERMADYAVTIIDLRAEVKKLTGERDEATKRWTIWQERDTKRLEKITRYREALERISRMDYHGPCARIAATALSEGEGT
jgi:hypothetical protein